jgi:Protein of unknown function (DUF3311)
LYQPLARCRRSCDKDVPLLSTVSLEGFLLMRRLGWLIAIAVLYGLHQDIWFWRTAHPLVFGFLPVGLAYHAAYCIAVSLVMWTLTRLEWPDHLEQHFETRQEGGASGGGGRKGSRR